METILKHIVISGKVTRYGQELEPDEFYSVESPNGKPLVWIEFIPDYPKQNPGMWEIVIPSEEGMHTHTYHLYKNSSRPIEPDYCQHGCKNLLKG